MDHESEINIYTIQYYGIDDKIWSWISNFLKQRVVVDGIQSNLVTVDSGVPQGTILGPILFLLHINDLPSVISSKVRLSVSVSVVVICISP